MGELWWISYFQGQSCRSVKDFKWNPFKLITVMKSKVKNLKLFLYSFYSEGPTPQVNVMTNEINCTHILCLRSKFNRSTFKWIGAISASSDVDLFQLSPLLHTFFWFVCGFSVNTQLIALVFLRFFNCLGLSGCKGKNPFDRKLVYI